MSIKLLELSKIIVDGGTDVRSEINEDIVNEYSEAAKDGAEFPPLTVFDTPDGMLIADGFHRYYGFERQGIKKHDCDIRKGTREDALKFALGCNNEHGYRRTHADKRNAVNIALKEFSVMTDRVIAKMCNVSHVMVGDMRKQLAPPPRPAAANGNGSAAASTPPPPRKGADGKNYKSKSTPTVAPATSSNPPPRPTMPAKTMDATNHPVPEEIIPHWNMALAESTRLLGIISDVRSRLKRAQECNEPMFREVNHNDSIAKLDLVYAELKLAKPYAVCIECQGVNTSTITSKGQILCGSCHGRGFVSDFYWTTCVPEEIKKAAGRE